MEDKKAQMVGMTIHLDLKKRIAFNEYARSIGISPGNLVRNFIYTTLEQKTQKTN